MAFTDQFSKGMYLLVDDQVHQVVDRNYKTQGRQGGLVRLKLHNLESGSIIDKTVKAGNKLEQVEPKVVEVIYSYSDGGDYYFMDSDTFENFTLPANIIGTYKNYIKEGDKVTLLKYKEKVINMRKPQSVVLEVVEAAPAVKGNTATGATKKAKVETGYELQVPLFIKKGDKITINTETGQYTGKTS